MRVRVPAPHRLDVIKRADFDAAGACVAADLVRNGQAMGREGRRRASADLKDLQSAGQALGERLSGEGVDRGVLR